MSDDMRPNVHKIGRDLSGQGEAIFRQQDAVRDHRSLV
jgi:hypothetical protein